MKKTLTARTRVFFSSVFENIWAIGVGSVVAHLSAKVHSTHNKHTKFAHFVGWDLHCYAVPAPCVARFMP